jgi:NAD(P)-dependent dehydrogenase (short-subunit alcohol dehydrogenase family)
MTGSLKDQTVLVVGRGSGLARAITLAALDTRARVVAAGRSQEVLSAAYADEPGVSTATRRWTPRTAGDATHPGPGHDPARRGFVYPGDGAGGRPACPGAIPLWRYIKYFPMDIAGKVRRC